jgi:hypothetical protein
MKTKLAFFVIALLAITLTSSVVVKDATIVKNNKNCSIIHQNTTIMPNVLISPLTHFSSKPENHPIWWRWVCAGNPGGGSGPCGAYGECDDHLTFICGRCGGRVIIMPCEGPIGFAPINQKIKPI